VLPLYTWLPLGGAFPPSLLYFAQALMLKSWTTFNGAPFTTLRRAGTVSPPQCDCRFNGMHHGTT
jgi:hypothetical protein